MFATFWHEVLYRPLLNILIFLYQNFAGENLGIAVIELTVAIRLLLLPLSIISERKQGLLESLSRRAVEIEKHFKNDPVKQREETRKLLKAHRVNPWAKVIVLAVQVLVLVLLYQVFLSGMRSQQFSELYDFVRRPDFVNTYFLGFNVAARNIWWAIAVGAVLFIEITISQYQRRRTLQRRDLLYRYAFPAFSVLILAQLPMVKSIFILTSIGFSALLFGVRKGVISE